MTFVEHLAALGVRCFIAVGPAPAIADHLSWGDCVVIDRALRDDGVSAHYLPPARYAAADPGLTERLRLAAERNGLPPRVGPAWTVPTPFRTTDEELTVYGAEGIVVTELVSAALFAVGTTLGTRVASAVVATTAVRRRRKALTAPETADRPSGRMTALVDVAVAVLQSEGVTA